MKNDSTVKMTCKPVRITLSAAESSTIFVKLQMDRGWHVNSNDPGNEYTVPLSFTSIDDNLSVEITWPESVQMVSAGERVSVFGDVVTIPIKLTASSEAKGKMTIMARWQSCNEDTCLAPEDFRVPCTIIVE